MKNVKIDKVIVEVLQEITKWDASKLEYVQPNHTYFLNKAGKMVGYVIQGTEKLIEFNVPKAFSKSYRKFIKIKEKV